MSQKTSYACYRLNQSSFFSGQHSPRIMKGWKLLIVYLAFFSETKNKTSIFPGGRKRYTIVDRKKRNVIENSRLPFLRENKHLPFHIDWLVVSTHLKNIRQIRSFPQVGVKIKTIWNHLENLPFHIDRPTVGPFSTPPNGRSRLLRV